MLHGGGVKLGRRELGTEALVYSSYILCHMRLRIVECNFLNSSDWIYKLQDTTGQTFYIMNGTFYKHHRMLNPISKKELDSFDNGIWVNASTEYFEGIYLVTKLTS